MLPRVRVHPRNGWFTSSESSSDDSSLDSAARRKKKELKDAAANWVAPTSTGVTNSEAIVQYEDLKTGKIYDEMEVIPVIGAECPFDEVVTAQQRFLLEYRRRQVDAFTPP